MTKRTYHHGNLQVTLIESALTILQEDGIYGLSLRNVAKRAGVSHGAPSHHFKDKSGLLSAVAAHGFYLFAEAMELELKSAGADPFDQLRAICHGYLKFAKEETALFQLIFSPGKHYLWNDELQKASDKSFGLLAMVCKLFEPSQRGFGVNEKLIWSMVHGYAGLRHLSNQSSFDTEILEDDFLAMLDSVNLIPLPPSAKP